LKLIAQLPIAILPINLPRLSITAAVRYTQKQLATPRAYKKAVVM
jgi:hypothetical protein